MTRIALTAFAMFFVTVAPLKAAPVFAVLTRHHTVAERRRVAVKAILIATALLTVFSVWGDDLLRVLGITLPAVRIGGGILLMLMAIQMVFGTEGGLFDDPKPGHHHGDIAVFPIAMPVVAGPGAITAVVILMSHHQRLAAQLVIFAMLLVVLLLTFVLFLIAGPLEAMIGGTAMTLITGVMGILLMALAAEFVVQGLRGSLFR